VRCAGQNAFYVRQIMRLLQALVAYLCPKAPLTSKPSAPTPTLQGTQPPAATNRQVPGSQ
jgi:hypothetical protein